MKFNCDLCGSYETRQVQAATRYRGDMYESLACDVCVCMNCGFVYVPYRRTSKEIIEAWKTIYSREEYDPDIPMVKARLWWVAECLDQYLGLSMKSVFDIGAGDGRFLSYCENRGADTDGMEPAKKPPGDIASGSIEDQWKGTSEYDIVTINWTLENCQDCIKMLSWAKDAVKTDGYVSVATGSRILVPFKKPISKYFSDTPADTHAFRFSANTLSACLKKVGLEPVWINDFESSDWLLVIAQKKEHPASLGEPPYDNPQQVLDFFEAWNQWKLPPLRH